MFELAPLAISIATFFLISLAAKQIGKSFSQYGLPYITGYLLVGAISGSFILDILSKESIESLRFIDDISLAIIAFIAGSELYLKELRSRLRAIIASTFGIVIVAFCLIGITIYTLQSSFNFIETSHPSVDIAIAILGATILLALSPASTIAVLQEVKARGQFSKSILSITVLMDVIIVILFAISIAFASALIDSTPLNVDFLLLVIIDIGLAIGFGYVIGIVIQAILSMGIPHFLHLISLIIIGFAVFEASYTVPELSYATLGVKLKIEPLLVCMIAGFTVTNFSNQRVLFEEVLHEISPYVYVAFFALTGAGLKLDVLISTLGIALVLFFVRMFSIGIGTYLGGVLANEPESFKRWGWLGLITQAGIALGIAREVSVEFPIVLGDSFATLIISVVVLNEIFGPLFLKFALKQAGEGVISNHNTMPHTRTVVIAGVETQTVALAKQLASQNWHVYIIDTNTKRVDSLQSDFINIIQVATIDIDLIKTQLPKHIDAVVAVMLTDDANFILCEYAALKCGCQNIVVRLIDRDNRQQFLNLGAKIIDQTSAMVNLLYQFVRAPEATNLLLHEDPEHDVLQITISEPAVDGLLLRDLRIPEDVLILEIIRSGQHIVPHGFTRVHLQDEFTLVGTPASIERFTLKVGF